MFFDDVKTLYDLDAPETHRSPSSRLQRLRKGDEARLDSRRYLPLQDLKVIDLDTAKRFRRSRKRSGTIVKLEVPIANEKQSAHIRITGR